MFYVIYTISSYVVVSLVWLDEVPLASASIAQVNVCTYVYFIHLLLNCHGPYIFMIMLKIKKGPYSQIEDR